MSIKKMSVLITSALVFFIILTTIIDVVKYDLYRANEKIFLTLNYKIFPDKMVKSYNYVEIKPETDNILNLENNTKVDNDEPSIEEESSQEISNEEEIFVGKMTGYGADCAGCSGVGSLACKTYAGTTHKLSIDGEYYNDNAYGQVRIVAADLSKFPCGTIVKVSNDNLGEFYAVVLDTGGSVQNAWANGFVWMDLAFKTETDPSIYSATNNNTTYVVQRWGW